MYQRQCRIIAKKEGRIEDPEAGPKEEEDVTKKEPNVEVASREVSTREGASRDGSEIELTEHSTP